MKYRKARGWLVLLGLLGLTLLVMLGQEFRLFERVWFQWREPHFAERWQERSLWLPDYQVQIEARPIVGLDAELSALTYDPDRNSLFSVTNSNPHVIELSLDGQLLRSIPLRGFADPEAIEYIAPGQYVISDERNQRLVKIEVAEDTQLIDAADGEQLSLGIGLNGNKGFEGLAYDAAQHRLFVAKERDPIRIYEVRGFPSRSADEPYAVHVVDNPKRDARLFVRDLSSLDYDADTGHLLALSDESQIILELNAKGRPISALSLKRGDNGLRASVPQAEGIASDSRGNLYLISEPNLFYKFSKPVTP